MTDPSIYRQLADLEERLRRLETAEQGIFIGASYSTNAGQSIPNDTVPLAVVDYEDVDYDPLGLVTTGAGWVFTCPVTGVYEVSAAALLSGTANWNVGEQAGLWVFANGALYRQIGRYDWAVTSANVATWLTGVTTRECAAGDTLAIGIYQNSGAALALVASAFQNYVAIARVR